MELIWAAEEEFEFMVVVGGNAVAVSPRTERKSSRRSLVAP